MIATAYRFDRAGCDTHLFPLLRRFYPEYDKDTVFRHGYEAAIDYCRRNDHIRLRPLAVHDAGAPVGHVALIADQRLGPNQAFFGFLELADDVAIFDTLWSGLKETATSMNIRHLKGPVNGSIWHQYRCVKESSAVPSFPTEPLTPLHHYRFLDAAGPYTEIGYSSAVRHSYARMLELMESRADEIESNLRSLGVELSLETTVSDRTLLEIASVSDRVFRDRSWGYTPLADDEFFQLYNTIARSRYFHKAFLLRVRGDLIGYAITLLNGSTMICKTICLLPEHQNMGIGNALALHLHRAAKRDGMSSIMYVLVRDGNRIYDFPMEDIEIFRRYGAFEFEIPA